MPKILGALVRRKRFYEFTDQPPEFGAFAQSSFEFRECHFDWIEVWRIGGQIADYCADGGDGLAHPIDFVGRRLMGWTPPGGICVPEWVVLQTTKEASMEQIITVGLDLAKHVFQVHGAGVNGAVVLRKKLRREQLLGFFAKLPRCTVAMEACGGAHHWAREIARLRHEVKLIAPAYVKPFVKRQKNDMADAEAICEAA